MQFRTDFGKRLRLAIPKAEPPFDDQPLFFVELRQKSLQLLLKRPGNEDFVHWRYGRIPDQLFELGFILLANRSAKGNFGRRALHHVANIFFFHSKLSGNLVHGRTMTQLLSKPGDSALETIEFVFYLRRQVESLSIMRNRGEDRLANPPTGVRDEPHTTRRIKARSSLDQAHIAFVNQLVQRIAGPRILFSHRNNESKVRLDQGSKSIFIAILNTLAKSLFFLRCQLRESRDLLQVQTQRVGTFNHAFVLYLSHCLCRFTGGPPSAASREWHAAESL